jgi:regulator of protease activity HflC (stomatin/prohibitin superfamily)
VPVNVDAAIFWHVHDAQKATLAITDYRQAIERVAQASVRKMIGASMSASLLSDRKTVGMHLRDKIGRMIADWSVPVQPGHVVRMTSTADLSGSRKLP